MSDSAIPLPPATFEFLVFSLRMQAEQALGLFRLPGDDGTPELNLPMAQHFIDLLGMLEQKTRGNLEVDEKRLVENSLTELRYRYVQASKDAQNKSEPASEISGADAPAPEQS